MKKKKLKGVHLKHRHSNKGVPASKDSILGNTLAPFLGNEHGWVPLKCLYSNAWNMGNKWGNRGQHAAAGLWNHPRGVVRIHTTEVLQWMETCPSLGRFKYRPGWHKGRVILWERIPEGIHEDLPSDEWRAETLWVRVRGQAKVVGTTVSAAGHLIRKMQMKPSHNFTFSGHDTHWKLE